MELRIFESRNGDCLLLEGSQGGRVLCDGGMAKSMRENVREHLAGLHGNGELDAVYVSHIDQDHISGVLQLLEDLLEWRIFEHHQSRGDTEIRPPDIPRPPNIGGLWHNSFRDLITRNRGRIEDILAASVPVLSGSGVPEAVHYASEMQNIAASIPEALRVSGLVKRNLLDIPLNQPPGRADPGQLLLLEDPNDPFDIGSLSFHLIGPTKKHMRDLRKGWDNWLRDEENRAETREIREELIRRVEEFSEGLRTSTPFDLGTWNGMPDFKGVTVPNTASLMFFVEDAGRSLLLTGDSQQDIILDALRDTGHLEGGSAEDHGHVHVDILKLPHHGSEHNFDLNFCRHVTADHYVFCANGRNGNPEDEVLQFIIDSRTGPAERRALTAEGQSNDRGFTFWFSTTSDKQSGSSADNFRGTEALVAQMVADSGGRLSAEFNAGDSILLRV